MYQAHRYILRGTQQTGPGFLVTATPPSGRAIILDGVDDFGTTTTSASMSNAVSGWRFMARIRGANLTGSKYIIRNTGGNLLVITVSGGALLTTIGAGFDTPGNVFPTNSSDFVLLVRSNPAATEVSVETWNLDGSGRQSSQSLSASSSATNFQSVDLVVGAFSVAGDFFTGKIDRAGFKSGAGTYNGTMPNMTTETLDMIDWTFDANNGVDANGNATLTLNGSPAFEDTP